MMFVEVLTIFPDFFQSPASIGLMGKAVSGGVVQLQVTDLRDFATDKHRTTDDVPFGGGAGMVMKPEPVVAAIEAVRRRQPDARVVLLTPQGRVLTQAVALELSQLPALALVCGRYEGLDERVRDFVDLELSIGDVVLAGGEAAALVVLEAVTRLLPGFVGNAESLAVESFVDGLLEYPQYTRPQVFRGRAAPEVLVSGDHRRIAQWRRLASLSRTRQRRPDLFARLVISAAEQAALERWEQENEHHH